MENRKILEDYRKEEWINGEWYMSPRPTSEHSDIQAFVFNKIYDKLKDKSCKVFGEVNLVLKDSELQLKKSDLNKYVIPDLFIKCGTQYVDIRTKVICIPDFVCEIVSPSSVNMDCNIKRDLYIKEGVKEYWVVNPLNDTITVFYGEKNSIYKFDDVIKVNVLSNLEIDFNELKDIRNNYTNMEDLNLLDE